MLTAVGGVIGVLLGRAHNLRSSAMAFPSLPPPCRMFWVGLRLRCLAAVGLVFGIYPAWKAANLDPIEVAALRVDMHTDPTLILDRLRFLLEARGCDRNPRQPVFLFPLRASAGEFSQRQAQERSARHPQRQLPPVSILKPLKGVDPEIWESFCSHCEQDYPEFQLIFGVSDPADPAIEIVRKLQASISQLARSN